MKYDCCGKEIEGNVTCINERLVCSIHEEGEEEHNRFKDVILGTDFSNVNDRDLHLLDWLYRQGFLSSSGVVFLSKVSLDREIKRRTQK